MKEDKLTQEIELTLKRMSGDYAAELSDEAHELLEFHLTQLLEAKREEVKKEGLVRVPYTTGFFVKKSTLEGLDRPPYTSPYTVAEAMFKGQQPSKVVTENELITEVTQAELLEGGWFCRDFSLITSELLQDLGMPHFPRQNSTLYVRFKDQPVFSKSRNHSKFNINKYINIATSPESYKEIVRINDKFYWVK